MKIRNFLCLFLAVLAFAACDSLEDTYKDAAGDGPIRYLGKCSDLNATIGWKRLMVTWTNSPDPVVDKVKLTWTKDDDTKEAILDKNVNSYEIDDLDDGNYEVTVCSIDKEGRPSLATTVYARPYTEKHEVVQSFTQIVSNHYFFKHHLVLFFLGWEDNIENAYMTYHSKDGKECRLELTPKLVNSLHYLVPEEIDESKPVLIYREGRIANCQDLITFSPVSLDNNALFNSDFKQEMKRQYGFMDDIPEQWVNSTTEIDFDRNIGSFTDLFNFPNLKTLRLGKNRFVRREMVDDANVAQSKVYDTESSDFVLKVIHQLSPDFTVERYDKHFSTLAKASYIKEMGQPVEPQHTYLDLKGLKFACDPEDKGYNSYVENLTDGNDNTFWEPGAKAALTTYTLDLDLKNEQVMHGVRLAQTFYEHENKRNWCPNLVKIFVSEDGDDWQSATYIEELEIGNSTGEIVYIPFISGGVKGRYLRVVVSTPYSSSTFNVSLAEVSVW